MTHRRLLAVASLALAVAQSAFAQTPPAHPGEAVYKRACATCHDNPTGRTPPLSSLKQISGSRLGEILFTGVMGSIGSQMPQMDIGMLIAWLTEGQPPEPTDWANAIACAADKRTIDTKKPVLSAGFGVDRNSTRSLTAVQSGLKKSQMKDLEVAWAIAYPSGMGGNGTGASVLGDTFFISLGGRTLAIDAVSGCAKWTYAGDTRNTPAIGEISGQKVVAMAIGPDIHVLDAATGALVWKASGQPATGSGGSIRGGVVFVRDKIIVPISNSGVAAGGNAKFECCTGHGSVVALNAADGKRLWEWHTMPEATYNGQVNSVGTKQRGPSGAPIWSVPLIDEKRNRVIVTTGEDTSHPTTLSSDAIIALDLDTGAVAWRYQAMAGDVWNMACDIPTGVNGPNCPLNFGGEGRDLDFGAGAVMAKGAGGKDVVLAGQKSGHVYALDAATGKLLWKQQPGTGTALGGVHWSLATWSGAVIVPINDPVISADKSFVSKAGVYAFDIVSGKPKWGFPVKADCTAARAEQVEGCETRYGFSAAPLIIDGAVVAGTLGGILYVIDAGNGKLLRQIDLVGSRAAINPEIAGYGGSIDSHGIFTAGGMVFVNSGYGSFGQTPGNLLIALKPKEK